MVWRMSPYERRRGGNALPGGLRGRSGAGNARAGQRGSGYSAAMMVGAQPDSELGSAGPASWRRGDANSTMAGRRVRQHRSFASRGKARPDKYRESRGQNRTREIRPSGIVERLQETWPVGMFSTRRARLISISTESRWPRPCVGGPRGRSEALDPGCTQAGYRASKWGCPGCRRGRKRRKAISLAAFSRAVSGPCGVEEPEHACDLLTLRTGRSRGCPCLSMMPRPGWFAGWHVGGWRDARGTSRRYALDERAREVGQARSTCEGAEQRCASGRGGAGGKGPA